MTDAQALRAKLAKVLARADSPQEGEAATAVRKACALVRASGLTWARVLAVERESPRPPAPRPAAPPRARPGERSIIEQAFNETARAFGRELGRAARRGFR